MTVEESKIIDYINNYFHQYFDFTLNKDITTTNFVNLVIPIETLYGISTNERHSYSHDNQISPDADIEEILLRYEDTTLTTDLEGFCLRVIDGDTLIIAIPYANGEGFKEERIRLVGVDTPEQDNAGYESSKMFLEKICYTKKFFELSHDENYEWDINNNQIVDQLGKGLKNEKKVKVKVDSKKNRDQYGRILGVLVVQNKNINEVLLKERFAQIMYIPPSEFNPHEWGDINTPMETYQPLTDEIAILSEYFNSDMDNVVFTPKNDYNTIYRYEVYKNVFFIKMNPFALNITMHLLPKNYHCSNVVLFLKDDMKASKTIDISEDYRYYGNKDNINSYYQVDGEDRDRTTLDSEAPYDYTEWNNNTHCEFKYDVSKDTQTFRNIEICTGYRYNKTSPYYSIHYTGAKDENKNGNRRPEDRAFLIDANTDRVTGKNNIITQMVYDDNNTTETSDDVIQVPPHDNIPIRKFYPDSINHVLDEEGESIIHKLHHKKVKYIHDTLYSEEDLNRFSDDEERYASAEWIDLSEPEH